MAKQGMKTIAWTETRLPLERYDDIVFVDLIDLERFVAELRDAGDQDDAVVEIWFGRIVDTERWTGLKRRRRSASPEHHSG